MDDVEKAPAVTRELREMLHMKLFASCVCYTRIIFRDDCTQAVLQRKIRFSAEFTAQRYNLAEYTYLLAE